MVGQGQIKNERHMPEICENSSKSSQDSAKTSGKRTRNSSVCTEYRRNYQTDFGNQ